MRWSDLLLLPILSAAIFAAVRILKPRLKPDRYSPYYHRYGYRTRKEDQELEDLLLLIGSTYDWYHAGRQMFQNPVPQCPPWSTVLGVDAGDSLEHITAAYKALLKKYHPDTAPDGKGDQARLNQVQNAYQAAKIAVKNRPQKKSEKNI